MPIIPPVQQMPKDLYPIDWTSPDGLQHTFTSMGTHPDGSPRPLPKLVIYHPLPEDNEGYNLALLDILSWDPKDPNAVSDTTVLTNNDRDKILDTAFHTMFAFFEKHPYNYVQFRGSQRPPEPEPEPGKRQKKRDPNVRIKAYKRRIFQNFEALKTDFEIQALIKDQGWTLLDSELVKNWNLDCQAFQFERIL